MGISSEHYPSGSVFQFNPGLALFGLLPLLTSSLSCVPLPEGGIADRRWTALKHCTAGMFSYSPTVQSGNRGAPLWWWIGMSCWRCQSVCLHKHFLSPPPLLPFPKPPLSPFPLLLLYPLPPCLSSAVNQAEAHSCFARLSVKDVVWLLFGLQHAELQVTLWNWARQINSVEMFSETRYYTGIKKISYFIHGNYSKMFLEMQ